MHRFCIIMCSNDGFLPMANFGFQTLLTVRNTFTYTRSHTHTQHYETMPTLIMWDMFYYFVFNSVFKKILFTIPWIDFLTHHWVRSSSLEHMTLKEMGSILLISASYWLVDWLIKAFLGATVQGHSGGAGLAFQTNAGLQGHAGHLRAELCRPQIQLGLSKQKQALEDRTVWLALVREGSCGIGTGTSLKEVGS